VTERKVPLVATGVYFSCSAKQGGNPSVFSKSKQENAPSIIMNTLTLDLVKKAVGGNYAAIRRITRLEPQGDKIFPPTYKGVNAQMSAGDLFGNTFR
jgi:hypothetical protein